MSARLFRISHTNKWRWYRFEAQPLRLTDSYNVIAQHAVNRYPYSSQEIQLSSLQTWQFWKVNSLPDQNELEHIIILPKTVTKAWTQPPHYHGRQLSIAEWHNIREMGVGYKTRLYKDQYINVLGCAYLFQISASWFNHNRMSNGNDLYNRRMFNHCYRMSYWNYRRTGCICTTDQDLLIRTYHKSNILYKYIDKNK